MFHATEKTCSCYFSKYFDLEHFPVDDLNKNMSMMVITLMFSGSAIKRLWVQTTSVYTNSMECQQDKWGTPNYVN
jgi:hypothetical protein